MKRITLIAAIMVIPCLCAATAGQDQCVSASGTDPGLPLSGNKAVLPLNWDASTDAVIVHLNTPLFQNFPGTLDASGSAAAQLNAPPLNPALVGLTLHFAFFLSKPFDFASNPVAVTIVP